MEIYLDIAIGECLNFIPRGSEAAEKTGIVIAPIKIYMDGDDTLMKMTHGCNMWQACHNVNCWYSDAAREANKKAGKFVPGA